MTEVQISPNGSLVAIPTGAIAPDVGSNIRTNGVLTSAAPGWPKLWIDDNRLLLDTYVLGRRQPIDFAGAVIYDTAGNKVASPELPVMRRRGQAVTANSIYSVDYNSIFSLTTGKPLFEGSTASGIGAVAGPFVIFPNGVIDSTVRAERY
jgi:hypothetical protein